MIVDYCSENKVAISFRNKEERDAVNLYFGRTDKVDITKGWLSHFKETTKTKCNGMTVTTTSNYHSSTMDYVFDTYTIITAMEFLELANEQVSVLDLI